MPFSSCALSKGDAATADGFEYEFASVVIAGGQDVGRRQSEQYVLIGRNSGLGAETAILFLAL